MSVYEVDYYTKPNGDQPIVNWLDKLDKRSRAGIMAKMQCLEEHGLQLLGTKMLKPIKGESNLYELVGGLRGQCRVIVYYDKGDKNFVLFNGFLKKRRRETGQINEARDLLNEYRSNK